MVTIVVGTSRNKRTVRVVETDHNVDLATAARRIFLKRVMGKQMPPCGTSLWHLRAKNGMM